MTYFDVPYHLVLVLHGGTDVTIIGHFEEQNAFNELYNLACELYGDNADFIDLQSQSLAALVEFLQEYQPVAYEIIRMYPEQMLKALGDKLERERST